MEYKHVGNHAEDLADGRMLGPGETVELSDEELNDPHNKRLVEEGIFIPLGEQDTQATDEAIKLAKANKVSLSAVTGSGAGGRITVADVERVIEEQKGGTES